MNKHTFLRRIRWLSGALYLALAATAVRALPVSIEAFPYSIPLATKDVTTSDTSVPVLGDNAGTSGDIPRIENKFINGHDEGGALAISAAWAKSGVLSGNSALTTDHMLWESHFYIASADPVHLLLDWYLWFNEAGSGFGFFSDGLNGISVDISFLTLKTSTIENFYKNDFKWTSSNLLDTTFDLGWSPTDFSNDYNFMKIDVTMQSYADSILGGSGYAEAMAILDFNLRADDGRVPPSVPEPASMLLLGSGLALLASQRKL